MTRNVLGRCLRIVLAVGAALALLLTLGAPASASSVVRNIVVSAEGATLTLQLDRPMASDAALLVERRLGADLRQSAAAASSEVTMGCNLIFSASDTNGVVRLERYCGLRQIRWDYTISATARAIIVGAVSETGLWYFINGVRQPRNSPHVVPSDYHLHGTMSGVLSGQYVQYQDYMYFRHNIGPGGTGSITFAGALRLV
jgi:hypothetical protein